jgi:hypothetical protein
VPALVKDLQRPDKAMMSLEAIARRTAAQIDQLIVDNWRPEYTINRPEVVEALGRTRCRKFIPQLLAALGTNEALDEKVKEALFVIDAGAVGEEMAKIVKTGDSKKKLQVLDFCRHLLYQAEREPIPANQARIGKTKEIAVRLLADQEPSVRAAAGRYLARVYGQEPGAVEAGVAAYFRECPACFREVTVDRPGPINNEILIRAVARERSLLTEAVLEKLLLTAAGRKSPEKSPAFPLLVEIGRKHNWFNTFLERTIFKRGAGTQTASTAVLLLGEVGDKGTIIFLRKKILGVGFLNSRHQDKTLCQIALQSLKKLEARLGR